MLPHLRAAKLPQAEYDGKVANAFNQLYEATKRKAVPMELSALRAVVLSDLHRGARDDADDFQRAERAYSAALGWYLEEGYELWLLGDVEELWENDIEEVVPKTYAELLTLEGNFATERGGPGLRRFWGNHDIDWANAKLRAKHLDPHLAGSPVEESLYVQLRADGADLGVLFLAHGHQGTDSSDRFSAISRFVVRRVWRKLQASQGWLSTSPAFDYDLRAKHDLAMFRWACGRGLEEDYGHRPLLIAGHTHHPVFPGKPAPVPEPPDVAKLWAEIENARAAGAPRDQLAGLRARYESLRAIERARRYVPPRDDPPCYFNGGCACYPDGDVTGIELDGAADEIRLVRWPRNAEGRSEPRATDSLSETLRRVQEAGGG